jgi:hypothetical protein
MDIIVKAFLTFRNQIKLYHWKSLIYSRHKITDEFLESFDDKIDSFIESMSGSRDIKVKDNFSIEFENVNDKNVFEYINTFKSWLITVLPSYLNDHETDLLNKRDDILSDINKMLYLFRFK